MIKPRNFLVGILALVTAQVFVGPASAQAHVETAQRFIATVTNQAINVLSDQGLSEAELERRLRSVLVENLAVTVIGRFVLGRFWNTSTVDEKREFLRLFEDVTVSTWSSRLSALNGQRFTVVGATNVESPNPDFRIALVRTTFGNGAEQFDVNWAVVTSNNIFKVTDVVISGVSLAQAQRDDFGAVLRDNGGNLSALNDILRARRDAAG